MNYREIVDYIEEIPKFTSKNPLDHTKALLKCLGDPQNQMQVIHVAGTNGKGSVCAYLDSMLRAGGYKVGLFTSPHLVKINERFKINGEMISDERFVKAFEEVQKIIKKAQEDGLDHPSYFETLFLMGMVVFKEADVDYVVLETGLGGRLDATTAVEEPSACVITSISFDHMQYLGNTIEAIAGEKAGIIVPGVPVIYDGNNPAAAGVIRARAQELGSPYFEVKREDTKIIRNTRAGIDFSYENEYYGNTVFTLPFIAEYQVMNSSLALKTIEVLKDQVKIPVEAVRKGLLETRWQGRMETVLPGVIVDGAHNEDGVEKFVETAVHFQKDYPLTLLFSAVDDKDYTDMIRTILGKISFHHVIVTQVGGYRKVPAEKLAEIFREKGCPTAEACEDVEEAFKKALAAKGEDGMLFCVGSLYLVGEIKTLILQGVGK